MSSTIERVTLTAPDLSCGHCVATVKEAVGGLAGVALTGVETSYASPAPGPTPSRVAAAAPPSPPYAARREPRPFGIDGSVPP